MNLRRLKALMSAAVSSNHSPFLPAISSAIAISITPTTGRAGGAALDAVFPGAGNPHFFSEQLAEGLEVWKVAEVWLGWTNEPNHYQDVTGFMELKLKALGEHRSQVEGNMLGIFEQWLPMEAEENGKKIGVQ